MPQPVLQVSGNLVGTDRNSIENRSRSSRTSRSVGLQPVANEITVNVDRIAADVGRITTDISQIAIEIRRIVADVGRITAGIDWIAIEIGRIVADVDRIADGIGRIAADVNQNLTYQRYRPRHWRVKL